MGHLLQGHNQHYAGHLLQSWQCQDLNEIKKHEIKRIKSEAAWAAAAAWAWEGAWVGAGAWVGVGGIAGAGGGRAGAALGAACACSASP